MPVLEVNETFRGQTADQDNKGIRRYVRVFQVKLAARTDSPAEALGSSSVPTLYAQYPDDAPCTVRKRSAARMNDHPQWWEVRLDYSNEPDSDKQSNDSKDQDPLDRDITVSCQTVLRRRVLERDFTPDPFTFEVTDDTRKAIVNSAGEKFDPPVEVDDAVLQITLVRNEPCFSLDLPRGFVNRVNKDSWNGQGAGLVRCTGINGARKFEKGIRYYEVTYTFELPPEGTDLEVLDLGMVAIVGGKRVLVRDQKDDTPLSKPWPLDGAGAPLAPGGKPKFLTFKPYEAVDFAPLNLGGIFF